MSGFFMLMSCTTSEMTPASKNLELPIPEQGYQIKTPAYMVPEYTEIELCTVVRLNPNHSEKIFWVQKMESLVTEGSHHMNVFIGEFSFLDAFLEEGASEEALGVPIGQYPCNELNTMERANTLFPSQRENQQITLPEGVAAPLTAPLLLVFSHHFINTTDKPVPISATLNIETIESHEVRDVAGLIFNDIPELEIPPHSTQIVERTCVVDRNIEVALVSSHNHQWGTCATMNRYDGETETVNPEAFFVNKNWDQPPILHFPQGTFSLSQGDGIHWACHFQNNTDQPLINDGTAEGEMCIFAAVTYPSIWSVSEVEEAVESNSLNALLLLMGDIMGGCDEVRNTIDSPWVPTDQTTCSDVQQTESNTID